jgi:hypothetical protein
MFKKEWMFTTTMDSNNNHTPDGEVMKVPPIPSISPLQLLYSFIQQQQQAAMLHQCSSSSSGVVNRDATAAAAASSKSLLAMDEILRVADFLFPRSLLDAALAVLEQNHHHHHHSGQQQQQPQTTTRMAHAITQISCSRRSTVFFVKPQTSKRQQSHSRNPTQENLYLCLIDTAALSKQTEESSLASSSSSSSLIQYCSCRSFLEKSIRRGNSSSPQNSNTTLCKHLLAIALLEPLGMTCRQIPVSSEQEWSQIVLQRIAPGGT